MREFLGAHAIRLAFFQTLAWCVYASLPLLAPHRPVLTDPVIDASFGLAMGLLIALRINQAYERWWEGRIQWGVLVNASRNLASKIVVYACPDLAEAGRVHRLIAGFARGLCAHLRGGARLASLTGFEDEAADPRHVPSHIATRINQVERAWLEEGRVTGDELRMLDLESRILLEVAGACERIRNTGIPPALTSVSRISIVGFLLGMPWVLQEEFGWFVLPVGGLAAFLLLVADTIASTLEHPFGMDLNHLDLDAYSATIEATTGEILGVEPR